MCVILHTLCNLTTTESWFLVIFIDAHRIHLHIQLRDHHGQDFCVISFLNFDWPEIRICYMSDFTDPWIIMVTCQYQGNKVDLILQRQGIHIENISPSN